MCTARSKSTEAQRVCAVQASQLLQGAAVQRITFVEVTKPAVLAALAAPREVARPLVDAYLARRAVDYLLGFHLTPVLWRKLPAAKSAGAQTSAGTMVSMMLLSSGSCNREMRAGKRWAGPHRWACIPPPAWAAARAFCR